MAVEDYELVKQTRSPKVRMRDSGANIVTYENSSNSPSSPGASLIFKPSLINNHNTSALSKGTGSLSIRASPTLQ